MFSRLKLRIKLLFFLAVLSSVFIIVSVAVLWSFSQTTQTFHKIYEQESSLTNVIQETFILLLESRSILDSILTIKSDDKLDDIFEHERNLSDAFDVIKSNFVALTWGSDSEAFKHSNDGLNYQIWQKIGSNQFISLDTLAFYDVQNAGIASLYFAGYAKNTERVVNAHVNLIKNASSTDTRVTDEQLLADWQDASTYYSRLVITNLSIISRDSGITIKDKMDYINKIQQGVFFIALLGFFITFIATLIVGYFLNQIFVARPLSHLIEAVQKFNNSNYKKRVIISSFDEFGILGNAFNEMANQIDTNTSVIVGRLKRLLIEQDTSAKLLIRRDLELRKANDKLTAIDKEKSKFISVAAHQLRTPLSSVKWALRMLIDGDFGNLTTRQKVALFKSYESNQRMIRLVNNLLNVDRIETGRFVYQFEFNDLKAIMSNVLSELTPFIQNKKLKINLQIKEIPKVWSDQSKIREVFQNLIDNAIKYSPVEGTITIGMRRVGNEDSVEITIADVGIGIPKDLQSNIFKKFFRAPNARKIITDGSGLGLYIVEGILEKHGGSISFKSEENIGTEFIVKLKVSCQSGCENVDAPTL